jgi:magnesium-transporting ATPase (P-type)
MSGKFLLIYICNFHVLSHLLLIYICKLHWMQLLGGLQARPFRSSCRNSTYKRGESQIISSIILTDFFPSSLLSESTVNPLITKEPSKTSSLSLVCTGQGLAAVRDRQPALLRSVIKHTKVFARTKPYDKKFVVVELMKDSISMTDDGALPVLFCGDGANDMAALRAATVGVRYRDAPSSQSSVNA